MRHLDALTCLTKLRLVSLDGITNKGMECLVRLVALRELELENCQEISDVSVGALASLTSLTKVTIQHDGYSLDN